METKVALLGDLAAFDSGLLGHDWKQGLNNLKEYLKSFDLVIVNLEVPITDIKSSYVPKGIHIKSNEKIIELLKYLKIDAVSLSNNHICDFGLKGMEDTINALDAAGIPYFGVNNRVYEKTINNEKLLFCGFCCYSTNGFGYIETQKNCGVNALTYKNVEKALEYAKSVSAIPIVAFHWGDEYTYYPNTNQIELAHSLADNFDFVLYGHHTHVMQGIEKYKSSILAYSLGNFYFDDCQSPINKKLVIKQSEENKESFILKLNILDGQISYETQGILYDNYCIKVVDNDTLLKKISNEICNNKTIEYRNRSNEMIAKLKAYNLVSHDFKWFLTKLNYHSIGAKIISYYYKHKYKGAYKKQ